jgi:CRP-like cAMP-binding protein
VDEAALRALQKAPLFGVLTERQQEQLAGIAKVREFAAGEQLAAEGDTGALAMWVVVDGKLDVRISDKTVASIGPGGHVGEIALLSATSRRTAALVGLEAGRAVQITKWDLEPMVRSNPDLAMAIIEELARRLEDANARLAAQA